MHNTAETFPNRAGTLSSLTFGFVSLLDLVLCIDTMLRFFDGVVPVSYIALASFTIFDLL